MYAFASESDGLRMIFRV